MNFTTTVQTLLWRERAQNLSYRNRPSTGADRNLLGVSETSCGTISVKFCCLLTPSNFFLTQLGGGGAGGTFSFQKWQDLLINTEFTLEREEMLFLPIFHSQGPARDDISLTTISESRAAAT